MRSYWKGKGRGIVAVAAGTLLAATLAGCGGGGDTEDSASGDGPLKIGVLLPLSGNIANVGESQQAGLKLGVEDVNKAGGIGGRQIELVIRDDGGVAANSRSLVQTLHSRENVEMVLGPALTSGGLAIFPYALQEKIPGMGTVSTDSALEPSTVPYYFSISPANSAQAAAAAKIAVTTLGAKKIGVLLDSTAYGDGFLEAYQQVLGAEHPIVATQRFQLAAADYTPQLSALRAAGVDVVLTNPNGADLLKIVNTRNQLGWDVPIIGNSNTLNPDVKRELGADGAKNVYGPLPFELTYPAGQAEDPRLTELRDRLGDQADQLQFGQVVTWYDVPSIIKTAVEKAGGLEAGSWQSTMESLTYEGLYATYSWSPDRHFGIPAEALTGASLADCDKGTCARPQGS